MQQQIHLHLLLHFHRLHPVPRHSCDLHKSGFLPLAIAVRRCRPTWQSSRFAVTGRPSQARSFHLQDRVLHTGPYGVKYADAVLPDPCDDHTFQDRVHQQLQQGAQALAQSRLQVQKLDHVPSCSRAPDRARVPVQFPVPAQTRHQAYRSGSLQPLSRTAHTETSPMAPQSCTHCSPALETVQMAWPRIAEVLQNTLFAAVGPAIDSGSDCGSGSESGPGPGLVEPPGQTNLHCQMKDVAAQPRMTTEAAGQGAESAVTSQATRLLRLLPQPQVLPVSPV